MSGLASALIVMLIFVGARCPLLLFFLAIHPSTFLDFGLDFFFSLLVSALTWLSENPLPPPES
ncbi:MAG: hypothetical protein A3J28_00440 [Acidobacteria bacterium RIFCSPLOWO2_12_FULL_60_22]|nr:MAG: hypothetical protein A3J28_00440 [Acidobacteria bacterium RIFCSPLOWO2_12_FULL_60_22]